MRRSLPLLILCAAAALFAPTLAAQEVDGYIAEARSRAPVQGATVVLLDSAGAEVDRFVSRRDGRFRLRAPAVGRYGVRAEVEGRGVVAAGTVGLVAEHPTEVTLWAAGGAVTAASARDSAIALAPIEVQGEPERRRLVNAGYYDRKRTTAGLFLNGAQFSARSGARVADALHGLRGTLAIPSGGSGFTLVQRRMGRRCQVGLWVDGIPRAPATLQHLRKEDVEAVEAYSANEMPYQFRVNAAQGYVCGAIVLWLKTPKS